MTRAPILTLILRFIPILMFVLILIRILIHVQAALRKAADDESTPIPTRLTTGEVVEVPTYADTHTHT